MNYLPAELQHIVSEGDRLTEEIQLLRSKKRLTAADLRRLADLSAKLLKVCPTARYAWIDGIPACDILKTLQRIEKEI